MSLCNRLYADGHVQHWCGSKDQSTVQLFIDTTTVLHERLNPSVALSITPYLLPPPYVYMEVQEVWFHPYLTLASGGCDIRNRETGPRTHQTWGWVGQRGSLEAIEKNKFSLPCPESNPIPR